MKEETANIALMDAVYVQQKAVVNAHPDSPNSIIMNALSVLLFVRTANCLTIL